ncbi:cation diffusion facilitator family transporter [Methanobrevibacter sp.]|uniref:cation diffusion facilitator family transporter n=1 Tax=Methanobrevibacter sp. TaxID=66852 RepID=UPI0025F592F1|nr:cation diffusion facilitator family transporter [Methanobrevibacter sp.]MBQ2962584.1 cation transporter [Methanobrevibacter sp.]
MEREDRERIGKWALYVAIAGNLFLTIFNIAVGIMSGSYALISEGAHTFSDITTSIIAYIGFRIGSRPADEEHPLGHGRAEAIAGLLIVIFLAIVAYEIITGAIDRLFFGGTTTIPSPLAVVMAIIGVITHFSLSQYIIKLGQRVNSPAIIADGKHQRVDIFASLAILFGVMIAQYGYPQLDPFIGFVIGLLIFKTAFDVARENLNNIMGKVPSQDLVDKIINVSNSVDKVCGTHDVRVNYLGSYATVSLHVELPPDMSLDESHKIVHLVQNKVVDEIDVIHGATVHACPVGLEYDHDQQLDE